MQKDAERTESNPSVDRLIAGSVNTPRSDDYVWNIELPAVLHQDFVLLDLCEGIGISTKLRMRFYWAQLIEDTSTGLSVVAVD
jgi:hypothetical protein